MVQGARCTVHGREVMRLSPRETSIWNSNGVAVNRAPCTVNHLFQYSNIPILHYSNTLVFEFLYES
jgi:hypothetical protein